MKKILLGLFLALGLVGLSGCGTYYGGGGYSHHHVIVVHHYHTPIVVHHYSTTHVFHHTTIVHHSTSSYSRPRVNLTKSYTSRSRH